MVPERMIVLAQLFQVRMFIMKPRPICLLVIAIVMALLPACTTATVPPAQPTAIAPATALPTSSQVPTQVPTSTQAPTPVPTDTPAPTSTNTPVPSVTPTPAFAGFSVEFAESTTYGLVLGLTIPGVKDIYRLDVNDVAYTCSLSAKVPDHLYCYGKPFKQGETVSLAFYPPTGDKTPIFQTTYKIVLSGTPTLSPDDLIAAAKACKIRGVHITCETEYRRSGDSYCEVSTCVDLCGYYYSVDTCPQGAEKNGYYPITATPRN
jgi:hypothetical protein